jgi:carbon-monoxide dehydrogenase large subunit
MAAPSPLSAGIGAAVPRIEDRRLLIGRGAYADDINLPGQAWAFVLRSPHAHAEIRGIDRAEAAAIPGILALLTGADWLADGLSPMRHKPLARHPPDIRLPGTETLPEVALRQFPLATDRARFVGEPVALIVAESLAAARDAAERLQVEWRPLAIGGSNILDTEVGDRAATEAAFDRAAHVVRLDTHVQRVTGVPMEPRAALAEYDGASGRWTIHLTGGSIGRPRQDVAAMLGVGEERVRVIARDVGGNFGTRNFSFPEPVLVAWAARRLARPIKWTGERQECFQSDYQGRDLHVAAELALDAEGRFLALRADNLADLGAYAASLVPLTKGTELMSSLYAIPAAAARARARLSNTPSTAPYRSAGRPEVMFVIERLVDLAARAHGFDRVELRRKNLIPAAALPYRNPFGMEYDSGEYEAALDRALDLADWDGFPARRAAAAERGRCRGIGVAGYIESQSGAPDEKAIVTVDPAGIVEVAIGTLSSGQGHETSFAQLLVEWLGVPLDTVRLATGDSDRVGNGPGSHSGRSLRLAGITMHAAAREIITKGKRIAAHLLEAAEADIAFADGRFVVAGTDRAVDLFAATRAASEGAALPAELRGPLAGSGDVSSQVASFPHGFHVAEVEVDPETGAVALLRYAAVDDVGRAVNPLILEGQAHGGIAQGMGQALFEHCIYDGTSGQLLTGTLMDYALPRAADLPMFATALSEVPSTTHPLGLRGGGEGGITPALGVVVNAIVDALADFGVSHIEMPATPERVWRAIREANRGSPV